jgi:hypothetical protein
MSRKDDHEAGEIKDPPAPLSSYAALAASPPPVRRLVVANLTNTSTANTAAAAYSSNNNGNNYKDRQQQGQQQRRGPQLYSSYSQQPHNNTSEAAAPSESASGDFNTSFRRGASLSAGGRYNPESRGAGRFVRGRGGRGDGRGWKRYGGYGATPTNSTADDDVPPFADRYNHAQDAQRGRFRGNTRGRGNPNNNYRGSGGRGRFESNYGQHHQQAVRRGSMSTGSDDGSFQRVRELQETSAAAPMHTNTLDVEKLSRVNNANANTLFMSTIRTASSSPPPFATAVSAPVKYSYLSMDTRQPPPALHTKQELSRDNNTTEWNPSFKEQQPSYDEDHSMVDGPNYAATASNQNLRRASSLDGSSTAKVVNQQQLPFDRHASNTVSGGSGGAFTAARPPGPEPFSYGSLLTNVDQQPKHSTSTFSSLLDSSVDERGIYNTRNDMDADGILGVGGRGANFARDYEPRDAFPSGRGAVFGRGTIPGRARDGRSDLRADLNGNGRGDFAGGRATTNDYSTARDGLERSESGFGNDLGGRVQGRMGGRGDGSDGRVRGRGRMGFGRGRGFGRGPINAGRRNSFEESGSDYNHGDFAGRGNNSALRGSYAQLSIKVPQQEGTLPRRDDTAVDPFYMQKSPRDILTVSNRGWGDRSPSGTPTAQERMKTVNIDWVAPNVETTPSPPPVTPPPEPSEPSASTLALTRLIDLENQMEYEFVKHMHLVSNQEKLRAEYVVLENLPVGIEALESDLEEMKALNETANELYEDDELELAVPTGY